MKDLRTLAQADANYKLHKGNLALAEAYKGLGDEDQAVEAYRSILRQSPISWAYYGLGKLLAKRGEVKEARAMMQEILTKQIGLPRYLRRQERPWVWRAQVLEDTLGLVRGRNTLCPLVATGALAEALLHSRGSVGRADFCDN